MDISTLFKAGKTVFSIEMFPPKPTTPITVIYDKLDSMAAIGPEYISVTYGAGGTRADDTTCRMSADIKSRYGIEPLAHLTCIHSTKEDIDYCLAELKKNGIENILALRGDKRPDREVCHDFRYASDLVSYIREQGGFNCVGACYPEGHPESGSLEEDIENLKIKVESGVTHLNTQLFFNNDSFYSFLEKARAKGINVPIEAGIMPVVNKSQIERIVATCGASLPPKFSRMMARYENNPEALADAGIAYAIDQIADLIVSGVDGIHLYSMNRPEIASRIYDSIKNMLR